MQTTLPKKLKKATQKAKILITQKVQFNSD